MISIVESILSLPQTQTCLWRWDFSTSFAASSGKQTSLVSMRPVRDFWVRLFGRLIMKADFGTSTTPAKRDSLRNSSGMPEAGTDAKSSFRKYIGFESNSVLACAKGETAA